ncbi:peptide chain release factor N(5)-glutamine methyltransferase [candidate division WOR-3 bacterium]|nr:peptide chain release factor N(5)-glutamine methyltransferase [candidate division WOR-3 bacterium]
MRNIADLIEDGSAKLQSEGIENFLDEAYYLLSHASGMSIDELLKNSEKCIKESGTLLYYEYLKKRVQKIPRQYITGTEKFFGLNIKVGPGVFIPRPETEILAITAEKFLKDKKGKVIECFSGSGAVSLCLSKHLPFAEIISIEISSEAVKWQKRNLLSHGNLSQKISLVRADTLQSLRPGNDIIAVVANPPYVPYPELAGLDPEIIENEPESALNGGFDGLEQFRNLSEQAQEILPDGSFLFSEIGEDQFDRARRILYGNGFRSVHGEKDLSGITRIVIASK